MKKMLNSKLLFILILVLFLVSACNPRGIRPVGDQGQKTDITSAVMPPNPDSTVVIQPEKNAKMEAIKDGVVLVLGPGLARSMAFIGVIKALEENNIPIKAIAAVEFSSVIAAIWASSSSNTLEWEVHKFKKETLLDGSFLNFRKELAPGEKIQKFIENAVKVPSLDKLKIPLLVGFMKGDSLQVLKAGAVKEILRSAVGVQGLLEPFNYDGQDSQSSILEAPLLVTQAKELNLGPTLCLDVLSQSDSYKSKDSKEEQLINLMKSVKANVKNLLSQCDQKILITVRGVGYLDFEKKTELVFTGKKDFKNWVEQK